MLNAATASFMGRRNLRKSWDATIRAHASRVAGFKRCCMLSGRYDGVERDHFFPRMIVGAGPLARPLDLLW
jgi:hypothetical protein